MAPERTSRLLFCLEVECGPPRAPEWVRTLISIPGRESTFQKVWQMPSGLPSEPQSQDIAAFITNWVMEALISYSGLQRVLDL